MPDDIYWSKAAFTNGRKYRAFRDNKLIAEVDDTGDELRDRFNLLLMYEVHINPGTSFDLNIKNPCSEIPLKGWTMTELIDFDFDSDKIPENLLIAHGLKRKPKDIS